MDRYLVQLAEDLRHSARNLPNPSALAEFDEDILPEEVKPFAEVERFLHGKANPIAVITGIETERFPPPEKLTESQISFLFSETTQTLRAYHFEADFPKGLPVIIKYRLLREKWGEEAVYIGAGTFYFEFCNYEPSQCPYPDEFCGCK